MFVKSTKNAFNRKIPDEGNINNFDLDFIDLFNVNRMHGTDRLEQSSRLDYGVSYTSTIKDSFDNLTTIQVGQSHQFDRKQTPRVLPRLLVNWRSNPLNNTLNYDTNIEFINFYRTKGTDSKKLIINQNFTFPTILNDLSLIHI